MLQKEKVIELVKCFLNELPQTRNGKNPFLTMPTGEKIFFRIFKKKYGLENFQEQTKYNIHDIIRRIQVLEFLDYIIQTYEVETEKRNGKTYKVVQTMFFRVVFLCIKTPHNNLELLSIYPNIK